MRFKHGFLQSLVKKNRGYVLSLRLCRLAYFSLLWSGLLVDAQECGDHEIKAPSTREPLFLTGNQGVGRMALETQGSKEHGLK